MGVPALVDKVRLMALKLGKGLFKGSLESAGLISAKA